MTLSIIIDILIVAILWLSLYLGLKKGMIRGLLALASAVIAIIAASAVADYAADFVIDRFIRPATHEAIEQRLDELDESTLTIEPWQEIENLLQSIENEWIREKALELLKEVELPTNSFQVNAYDPLTLTEELVDSVLYGAFHALLSAAICILCYFLISLALRPVQYMIEEAFELPVLRQINQLGGLLSGTAKGILVILFIILVLRTAGIWLTDDVVEGSYLLKFAVNCMDRVGLFDLFHS